MLCAYSRADDCASTESGEVQTLSLSVCLGATVLCSWTALDTSRAMAPRERGSHTGHKTVGTYASGAELTHCPMEAGSGARLPGPRCQALEWALEGEGWGAGVDVLVGISGLGPPRRVCPSVCSVPAWRGQLISAQFTILFEHRARGRWLPMLLRVPQCPKSLPGGPTGHWTLDSVTQTTTSCLFFGWHCREKRP